MKKHIDGIIYNTDNMEVVGTWDNGRETWHEFYYAMSLLRTKKNKYFIYYKGGEKTDMKIMKNGVWNEGEDLIPVTLERAQEWALEHMSVDDIIKAFPGLLVEDE